MAGESVALIGYGNMGQALIAGWLAAGRPTESLLIIDSVRDARDRAGELGLKSAADPGRADACDVVVLAVKPAQLDQVLATMDANRNAVYLSMAAGRTLSEIAAQLGDDVPIVRAMPNTPAAIGQGMTGLCANENVRETQRQLCTELMSAVGAVTWLRDEALMDAVTAVSGSGPAYVFLLIECLTEAGLELGLDAPTARLLATKTVAGSGAYAAQSGIDANELRQRVTSPGGTTEAALKILTNANAMQKLITAAVRAAAERSKELAEGTKA